MGTLYLQSVGKELFATSECSLDFELDFNSNSKNSTEKNSNAHNYQHERATRVPPAQVTDNFDNDESFAESTIMQPDYSVNSAENPDDSKRSIKGWAIALLARREHSQKELVTKLSRKFSDVEKIKQEVESLAEHGLQSDERFVENFIRAKKSQGKGPSFIKQDLRQRGVSEYLIASYVYDNDDDWIQLAQEVYDKKFGDVAIDDAKEKARRIRFMVSRGFSPDMVFRIIDNCERYA